MPRRSSSSSGQNDTFLYAFTVIILVVALSLGYYQMPSPTPPVRGLDKALFNHRLYSRLQDVWFAEVPTGATIGGEASTKKWFSEKDPKRRAVFDQQCRKDFGAALQAIGPKRLRLPPFTTFPAERQAARNLASPLMSEIDTYSESSQLDTDAAASNALSLILLLDQVSRNVCRNPDPAADDGQAIVYTHYDRMAQALIHHILASKPRLDLVDKFRFFPVYRMWFYMPLMHSEHVEDHVLFNDLVGQMREDMAKKGDEEAVAFLEQNMKFEEKHRVILERFGRYPYRNEVVGRETTEEERRWLEEGGERFGTG